jgi:hypothetical protein
MSHLPELDPRVSELVKERDRLMREVSKKKRQLAQARAKADADARAQISAMAPLIERHASLARELSRLFAELLAPGRLPQRAARQVEKARRALELSGHLTPRVDDQPDDEPENETEPTGHERSRSTGSARADRASTGVSANKPAEARHPSLRELFRSLALAVHPDRARTDAERAQRTEVMKEVSRAYEAGDLARLLELERSWQLEFAGRHGDSEPSRHALERQNRELLNQVRTLTEQIKDVKRRASEALRGPLERVVARARREFDDLEEVCEHARRFLDGKISLTDFLSGPFGAG